MRPLGGQLQQRTQAQCANFAIMQPYNWVNIFDQLCLAGLTRDLPKKAVNVAEPFLEKVEQDRAAVILRETVIVKRVQDHIGVAPEAGDHHLQAHGAQLGADDLARQPLKHNLEQRGKHVIDLVVTLQDHNLEQLGRVALCFIVVHICVQNLQ